MDPRMRPRTRMFGWRQYQQPSSFAIDSSPPVVISPAIINPFSYIVDTLGDFITDTSGNRLIVND